MYGFISANSCVVCKKYIIQQLKLHIGVKSINIIRQLLADLPDLTIKRKNETHHNFIHARGDSKYSVEFIRLKNKTINLFKLNA